MCAEHSDEVEREGCNSQVHGRSWHLSTESELGECVDKW